MGIFDKKTKGRRSEDFDSPVETVDLDGVSKSGDEPEATTDSTAQGASEAEPVAAKSVDPVKAVPKAAKHVDQDYGIEEAIALMRTLPSDSIELVVRVVKQTLESTHIDIPTIIVDATAKQERIRNRIAVLKEEIIGLEQEISARSTEISTLEADHDETSTVKERLELAEKLGQKDKPQNQSSLPAPSKKPLSPTPVAKK